MWNSKLDVYRTEWLDLVFDNRNKSYGAYELRRHNSRTTIKAFLMASGLVVSMIIMLFLYSEKNQTAPVTDMPPVRDILINLSRVTAEKLPQQAQQKVEQSAKAPQNVSTKKFVNLRVVSPGQVIEEPAAIEDIQASIIGLQNAERTGTVQPIELSTGTGTGNGQADFGPSTSDEAVSTDFLEKYPEFPGGEKAFAKYLARNLRYPYLAVENNIAGRVLVGFIIEKNGDLSNIKVIRGIGGGCDEEAVRVLEKSPAWTPGKQNGRLVRVAYTVPIYFQLSGQ